MSPQPSSCLSCPTKYYPAFIHSFTYLFTIRQHYTLTAELFVHGDCAFSIAAATIWNSLSSAPTHSSFTEKDWKNWYLLGPTLLLHVINHSNNKKRLSIKKKSVLVRHRVSRWQWKHAIWHGTQAPRAHWIVLLESRLKMAEQAELCDSNPVSDFECIASQWRH